MNSYEQQIIAQLQKPGAGLPLPARILNFLYLKPFVIKRADWDISFQNIQIAQEKIKIELMGLRDEALTKRVLIPPQIGLEDSSRYWSVAMTTRHLTIVGTHMQKAIIELSQGIDRTGVIGTAEVKPEEEKNRADSAKEFILFADSVLEKIKSSVKNQNSKATARHPWFGPLNCKDWMWVFAAHNFIHLKQIRKIKQGL